MSAPAKPREFHLDFLAHPHVARLVARTPRRVDPDDALHLLVFRNVLKIAMLQGRWSGKVARVS